MRFAVTERFEASATLLAQAERAVTSPWHAKMLAAIVGFAHAIVADLFGGFVLIVSAFSLCDWFLGRRAAKADDTFDPRISENGLIAKTSGVLLLVLFRGLEHWAGEHGLLKLWGWDVPPGAIATGFAATVLYEQWRSIARNHERLGRPLPFAAAVEAVAAKIRGAIAPGTPKT